MAEIKISELSSGSALSGTEVVPIVQSGATVKVTTQDIADLGGGGDTQFKYISTELGSTVTGNGTGISKTIFIPSGTLSIDNTMINIVVGGYREAGTSNIYNVIYFNTSNSLTGATIMSAGQWMTSTPRANKMERTYTLRSGNLITSVSPGSLLSSDILSFSGESTYSYNPSTDDLYIILGMNNLGADCSSYVNMVKLLCY